MNKMSSPILSVLVFFIIFYESKCLGDPIGLRCAQITEGSITLQWKTQRFYSKSLYFISATTNNNETLYYSVEKLQTSLVINTTDKCTHYEFSYIVNDEYETLSYSRCSCNYIPPIFENIRFSLISSTMYRVKWDIKENKCDENFEKAVFLVTRKGHLKMMLERKNTISSMVTGQEKYELLLSVYDPRSFNSAADQLGNFGIPTRISFSKPTKQIFYDVKVLKRSSNRVLVKWKIRDIASNELYKIIVFYGKANEPYKMNIFGRYPNFFSSFPVQYGRKYTVIVSQYLDGKFDWPLVINFRNPCKHCKIIASKGTGRNSRKWRTEHADNQIQFQRG
ncbi:unnamed protein product [Heterobilharzia americana]|nr:unnamed protein product [Heterobilharzia americana]